MARPSEDHGSHPPSDPLVGSELDGRYVVGRRIARGGMGAIYEGIHLELGRKVAVKVLSEEYADDEEAIARFQREARASSRIDHPNIVAILDLGRLEAGEPYLVMELLDGEDLCEVVAREAPMPPARVIELLAPVANALDAVHAQGLLHRDIKPGNIFLARRADGVTPKLLDFGLAALREAPEHDRLTREGIVVGTPHYVSPEAAEGKPLDARADVYSLAVLAFELLSGVLPFDGGKPMSLLYAKVRRPAPTLSQATDRRFDPVLEHVLARSLSRTLDKRPDSAGELVRLLREAVDEMPGDPTSVDLPRTKRRGGPNDAAGLDRTEPSKRMTFSLPLRGPSERWSFAAACGLLLVALFAGWSWLIEDGSSESGETSAPMADVERGPAVPRNVLDLPEETRPGEPPAGLEAPSESELWATAPPPRRSPRRPAPERAADDTARDDAVETAAPVGLPRSTEPAAAIDAPPTAEGDPAEENPARAEALAREAGVALLRGQFPRARTLYRQATYADSRHASAWRGLGLASERMGMTPEAVDAYRRYLRLAPSAGDAAQVRARLARLTEDGR